MVALATIGHPLAPPWSSEVAKELAKLISLILEKSKAHDKKLEAIGVTTKATDSKLADIAYRISQVESHFEFLEEAHERQQANLPASAEDMEGLQQKIDSLENFERRFNPRFVGFPHNYEEGDALEFLVKVLPKILDLDFPASLEIYHAQRTGPVCKSAAPYQPPLAKLILFWQKGWSVMPVKNEG